MGTGQTVVTFVVPPVLPAISFLLTNFLISANPVDVQRGSQFICLVLILSEVEHVFILLNFPFPGIGSLGFFL